MRGLLGTSFLCYYLCCAVLANLQNSNRHFVPTDSNSSSKATFSAASGLNTAFLCTLSGFSGHHPVLQCRCPRKQCLTVRREASRRCSGRGSCHLRVGGPGGRDDTPAAGNGGFSLPRPPTLGGVTAWEGQPPAWGRARRARAGSEERSPEYGRER